MSNSRWGPTGVSFLGERLSDDDKEHICAILADCDQVDGLEKFRSRPETEGFGVFLKRVNVGSLNSFFDEIDDAFAHYHAAKDIAEESKIGKVREKLRGTQ